MSSSTWVFVLLATLPSESAPQGRVRWLPEVTAAGAGPSPTALTSGPRQGQVMNRVQSEQLGDKTGDKATAYVQGTSRREG